ncbi:transmembrane protein fam155b [Plakobranchus ocellatus]|uniref:Transmembrane protein fam155b n=1 Tax=Plakobranchus ocellatus TaxID=259542 RepID=A0AAV3XTG3_9GAST|nr:transmembrane protein fam155b [Plakobranchus ocellatus]
MKRTDPVKPVKFLRTALQRISHATPAHSWLVELENPELFWVPSVGLSFIDAWQDLCLEGVSPSCMLAGLAA